MRNFLIGFTVQTYTGAPASPGRGFVTAPDDVKLSRETIEAWEGQLREAQGLNSVGINNVVELEA